MVSKCWSSSTQNRREQVIFFINITILAVCPRPWDFSSGIIAVLVFRQICSWEDHVLKLPNWGVALTKKQQGLVCRTFVVPRVWSNTMNTPMPCIAEVYKHTPIITFAKQEWQPDNFGGKGPRAPVYHRTKVCTSLCFYFIFGAINISAAGILFPVQ